MGFTYTGQVSRDFSYQSSGLGVDSLYRIISLDHQITGRPLATRPVRETDYLPLEPTDMDTPGGTLDLAPKLRYCVSAKVTNIGSFGREAQAVYMFDRVRLAIEAGNTSPHCSYPLGRELQTLLSMVMEQVAGRSGIYCGATQILIVYVTVPATYLSPVTFYIFLDFQKLIRVYLERCTNSTTQPLTTPIMINIQVIAKQSKLHLTQSRVW